MWLCWIVSICFSTKSQQLILESVCFWRYHHEVWVLICFYFVFCAQKTNDHQVHDFFETYLMNGIGMIVVYVNIGLVFLEMDLCVAINWLIFFLLHYFLSFARMKRSLLCFLFLLYALCMIANKSTEITKQWWKFCQC